MNSELFSLLFQSAVHHAMAGRRVTFICSPDMVDEQTPKMSSCFDLKQNQGVLRRINMKYCGNMLELCQSLTHFHLFGQDDVPQILIIHDLVRFLELSLFNECSKDKDGDDKDHELKDSEPDQMEIAEDGPDEGGQSDFNRLEMELQMTMMDEQKMADFLREKDDDDDGEGGGGGGDGETPSALKLAYDLKLSAFLPVLVQSQNTAARIMRGDGMGGNGQTVPALKDMLCIIGMECLSPEFDGLYPL